MSATVSVRELSRFLIWQRRTACWMFCGHDHLNTLSLIYKGIQMTYGMSIDYLGYKDIQKSYIQRGGTLITRKADGSVDIRMVPLGAVVSPRVRGC